MSHTVSFETPIKNADALRRACDRRRAAGDNVVGPRSVASTARPAAMGGGQHEAHLVRLDGWRRDCVFFCDENGSMIVDNYSPYTSKNHPKVASGEKRIGEDGQWGDLQPLDRLQMEYRAVLIEDALPQVNGVIISTHATDDMMELVIQTP